MNLNTLFNINADTKNNLSSDNLKHINNLNIDNNKDTFENIFNKAEFQNLNYDNELSNDLSLVDYDDSSLIKSGIIKENNNNLKNYETKPISLILLNLLNNDAQNKELLINQYSKEFSIPKEKIENLLNKYVLKIEANLSKLNNDAYLKDFINELNLNEKNLNKAMDILSNVISKNIVKENIKTAQKNYNSEELFLVKDFVKQNQSLHNLNDGNIIKDKYSENIKTLKQQGFLEKELSANQADNQEGSKNTNENLNSGANLDFSKNIDFINKDYNLKELNINEKININLVKDTLISNVKILSDKDGGFIKLDLKSMDLGNLSLKVETLSNNKVAINLICENNNTKKLLEANLTDLKSALASLNIKADSININLNDNNKAESETSRKDYLASNDKGGDKQKDQNKKEGKN